MAVNRNRLYWLFSLVLIISVLGVNACKPQEINLIFRTVEQEEWSSTGEVYEDRKPGLVFIAHPGEVIDTKGWITGNAEERLQAMDYDVYFAVSVFQGLKPTDGYGVQIEQVKQTDNKVTIYAQFQEPQPDQKKNDIVTSPYHLIQVQKVGNRDQDITFSLVVNDVVVISLSHFIP